MTHSIKKLFFLMVVLCYVLCMGLSQAEDTAGPEIAVGNTVTLGRFEQDNDPDNGPDPIEWIVLDIQDGKALLLSQYGLAQIPFDSEVRLTSDSTSADDITWDVSTIRRWLNDDFFHAAFSESEQSIVLVTEVDNSPAQGCRGGNSGENTQDQIFLLSYLEANRYLDVVEDQNQGEVNERAIVKVTPYAMKQHGNDYGNRPELDENGFAPSGWWLRTHDTQLVHAEYITLNGFLDYKWIDYPDYAVRPALWVSIDALKAYIAETTAQGTGASYTDQDIEGSWIVVDDNENDYLMEHINDGSLVAVMTFHDGELLVQQIFSDQEDSYSGTYQIEGNILHMNITTGSQDAKMDIEGDILTLTIGTEVMKLQRRQ